MKEVTRDSFICYLIDIRESWVKRFANGEVSQDEAMQAVAMINNMLGLIQEYEAWSIRVKFFINGEGIPYYKPAPRGQLGFYIPKGESEP